MDKMSLAGSYEAHLLAKVLNRIAELHGRIEHVEELIKADFHIWNGPHRRYVVTRSPPLYLGKYEAQT
jgi:hypothetical protein